MKREIILSSKVLSYDHMDELAKLDQQMIRQAEEALANSYAPYSHFRVGASILLEDQTILMGSNQENASYPLCVCAETSVLTLAGSNYPDHKIITLAITAQGKSPSENPAAPCGACRQIILEYENRQNHPIRILLYNKGLAIIEIPSIKNILPLFFDNTYL